MVQERRFEGRGKRPIATELASPCCARRMAAGCWSRSKQQRRLDRTPVTGNHPGKCGATIVLRLPWRRPSKVFRGWFILP